MRYSKGESGNPQGRPKGAKNKVKARVLELIGEFVEANLSDIQKHYDELEPKEKLRFLSSMLNYVAPKQQGEPQQREETTPQVLTYYGLSDEAFEAMRELSEDHSNSYIFKMSDYDRLKEEGKI